MSIDDSQGQRPAAEPAPGAERPRESWRLRAPHWGRKHPLGAAAIAVGLLVLILLALLLWRYLRSYESTDDAQIEGHIAPLGARISGTVQRVLVDENVAVRAGQLLVTLDPRDRDLSLERARARLARAEANLEGEDPRFAISRLTQSARVSIADRELATTRAQLAQAERDHDAERAKIEQAQATATRTRADHERATRMLAGKAITRREYDERLADHRTAEAQLESARQLARAGEKVIAQQRARVRSAEVRQDQVQGNAPREVSARRASLSARRAEVRAARAAVEQARLDRAYTRIVSPFDGLIGRRGVEPGQQVAPAQQLLALVDVSHLWVTANFKETQLEAIHVGQRVSVHVDAFDESFTGSVESLGAASGSRFSLLPPENATGNFVKVVQRLPVRIRLEPGQPGLERLRPGMSVVPRVWLR